MTGGIIDRFRTMSIGRGAVLGGHVLSSLIQSLVSILVVLGVAIALGFRPTSDPLKWLAALGLLALFAFALIWLAAALGLAAKSVETASNTPMFLTMLPFLGSAFVPVATMPRRPASVRPLSALHAGLPRRSAACLTGTHIGANAIGAVAWSVGIAVLSYLWAMRLYERREPR